MTSLTFDKDGYNYKLLVFADYDYDSDSDSDCDCDSYCRCSTINNVEFIENSANVHLEVRKIRGSSNAKKLDKSVTTQVTDHIQFIINKNPSEYIDYSIVQGYYGEELIIDISYKAIRPLFDDAVSLYVTNSNKPKSHSEIIELLKVEYGYIAPIIQNTKGAIRISMDVDKFFNEVSNSDKFLVSKNPIENFKYDYKKNVAGVLYRLKDGRYFLVDGHHRTSNALSNGIKTVSYYVLYD